MEFIPGEMVAESGIYRVEHDSHRLMHEAALQAGTRFPRCKQCKDEVRFYLVRPVATGQILPFHVHAFLEEYSDSRPTGGRFHISSSNSPACRVI